MRLYEKSDGLMETGDPFKNGRRLKSQTNRGRKLMVVILMYTLWTIPFISKAQSWDISDHSTSGNSVTAVLNGNTLSISGNGNMADFDVSAGDVPWYPSYRSSIKTVIIESGVKNIGNMAFLDCKNLTSVRIPNTVIIIGKQSFSNCTSLPTIAIPSSATTIEENAFNNCTGLQSVVNLATTPQNINNNVFQGVNLNNIALGVSEGAIDLYKTVAIWKNFKAILSAYIELDRNLGNQIDNAILGIDGTGYIYEFQKSNPNIPKRLTMYNSYNDKLKLVINFDADGLPNSILSDSVTIALGKYEENRFNAVVITNDGKTHLLEGIETDIFWNEYINEQTSGLRSSATNSPLATANLFVSAISCGFSAFLAGVGLGVNVAADIGAVLSCGGFIGDLTEYICVANGYKLPGWLTGITTSMSIAGVELDCIEFIITIDVVSGVQCGADVLGLWLKAADVLTENAKAKIQQATDEVYTCSSPTAYGTINTLKWTFCSDGTLTIAGNGALSYNTAPWEKYKTQITKLYIGSEVTSIPNNAFTDCTSLREVRLESGSKTISFGSNVFFNSSGFMSYTPSTSINTVYLGRNIYVPDMFVGQGSYPFAEITTLKTLTISSNVKIINANSFKNTGLTSITIPNSLETIGGSAFEGCSSLASVNIGSKITKINSFTFRGCTSLTTISIPQTITEVGNNAFEGCTSLREVRVENGSEAISFGSNVFFNSSGFMSYTPSASINTIYLGRNIYEPDMFIGQGSYPFAEITTLKTLIISNNVEKINANSFKNTGLTSVTIPNSVKTIGNSAFQNAELTKITIPNSITSMGTYVFADCRKLTDVTILNSVIGNSTFLGCTSLVSITIPSNVTEIGSYSFSDCTNLKEVKLENGSEVISFGSNVFFNSSGFMSYTPSTSINTVYLGRNIYEPDMFIGQGSYPFADIATLKTLTISNNVEKINANSFKNTGLTSVIIPNSVQFVGNSTFENCTSLTSVDIGSRLAKINSFTFRGCTGLATISIPQTITDVGNNAFEGCTSLREVRLESGSETISFGSNVFFNSSGFMSYIPSTSINTVYLGRNIYEPDIFIGQGSYPFADITTLKTLTITNNVKKINANSFRNTGLTLITCNATTPPTLQSNTFSNVSKSIPVYINCNYLSAYQSAQYWSEFTNYQCAVQIIPESNSASVTFPKIDNAATYTLSIYSDENHTKSVTEIYLDSNGKPKSVPVQNALRAETALSFTVSGLSANTRYYYSLAPYNADGYMLTVFTGDFTTSGAGSDIENIVASPISIFPNPIQTDIFIKSELQIKKVEIYSLTGALLILENNFNVKISVSVLPKGIYLIKIYTDKGSVVSRIMKE